MKKQIYKAPRLYSEEILENDVLTASLEGSDSEERTQDMRENLMDAFGNLLN